MNASFLTMTISLASIIFVYVVSVPIALYSAINQYSIGDYFFSFLGLIGLATPNFLIALVFMIIMLRVFGVTPGGLFSPEYLARALEPGEVRGHVESLTGPSGGHRHGRHRRVDTYIARAIAG